MNIGAKTFTISSLPYYDSCSQIYSNILTINLEPQGPLKRLVRRINFPHLSPFTRHLQDNYPRCGLALISLRGFNYYNNYNNNFNCGNNLMTPNEVPDLITYLLSNGYLIDTQITNMLNQSEVKQTFQKMVFTVTYYGENQPNITYIR
jgi:hypothetical protein